MSLTRCPSFSEGPSGSLLILIPFWLRNGNTGSHPLRVRYAPFVIVLCRVSKRCTNAEKDFRVKTIYGLLSHGWPRGEVCQYAAKEWQVHERTADRYIDEARELIDKDCQLTRQQFLAEALDRLRTYEIAAAKRGQMQVATNSVRLQAELIGLTN